MRTTLRVLALAALVIGFALPARAGTNTDALSRPLDFTVFAPEVSGPDAVSFTTWEAAAAPEMFDIDVPAMYVEVGDGGAEELGPAARLQAIPEPATLLLFGCGMAGLLARSRRG